MIRLITLLWCIAWLLVSVFSPGSMARQAAAGEHQSAVWAILHSFIESFRYLRFWTREYVLLLMLCMVPVYWGISKQVQRRFSHPLLVLLLSFCVFATEFTPNLYALGIIGAYRVQNLYRFSMYLFLMGNEFYCLGYLQKKLADRNKLTGFSQIGGTYRYLLYSVFSGVVLLSALLYFGGRTVTTVSAIWDLRHGIARNYWEEYQERVRLLEDPLVRDVELKPYTWPPYLLFLEDVSENPSSWGPMANYYKKDSVKVYLDE